MHSTLEMVKATDTSEPETHMQLMKYEDVELAINTIMLNNEVESDGHIDTLIRHISFTNCIIIGILLYHCAARRN